MTPHPRDSRRTASLAAMRRNLDGLVATLNVAFMAAALMFSVLSLVWAVNDRSVPELVCAIGLLVAGALLGTFIEAEEEAGSR